MGRTTPRGEPIDRDVRARRRADRTRRHPNRIRFSFGIVMLLALLAGACGGDGSTSFPITGAERGVDADTPEESAAAGTSADAGTEAAPPSTLVPPTPTDPPRADPPMIGELILPCGRLGDGSDIGIDDESIVLGVGNDRGGRYTQDSGRGVVEAVRALADHCNASGGIAGRQIVVEELDAAVVEVGPRMAEACPRVFALVGHAYLNDHVGETTRLECGLPSFPTWSPGVGDEAELFVSALTATPLPVPLHGNFAALVESPADGGRIALVGPDTPGGREVRTRRAFALSTAELPFEIVTDVGYPIEVEPDWASLVSTTRRAGAVVVYLDGPCRSVLVPFLKGAAEAGWDPTVVAGPEAYDSECIESAEGVSFERLLVEMPLLPVEDGEAAPATAATVEIFAELGVPVTGDSLRAASAFWLWAVAADACGSALDRPCVVERAVAIEDWTAGGLHAATDPGTSATEPCAVLLGVEDGAFVRRLPVEPGSFDCDTLRCSPASDVEPSEVEPSEVEPSEVEPAELAESPLVDAILIVDDCHGEDQLE